MSDAPGFRAGQYGEAGKHVHGYPVFRVFSDDLGEGKTNSGEYLVCSFVVEVEAEQYAKYRSAMLQKYNTDDVSVYVVDGE